MQPAWIAVGVSSDGRKSASTTARASAMPGRGTVTGGADVGASLGAVTVSELVVADPPESARVVLENPGNLSDGASRESSEHPATRDSAAQTAAITTERMTLPASTGLICRPADDDRRP